MKVKRWGKIESRKVPIEFDLLNRVNNKHSSIIEMLDWYERRSSFVLVMERPAHSIDLFEYINRKGAIQENHAKHMLKQLIEVMVTCLKEGVFHRDVKDENIMLCYDTYQIKLIDFGCGTNLKKTDYTEFAGTPEFYPPEWFTERRYNAETQTVWSLGVLLWAMLQGEVPFASEQDIRAYSGHVTDLKQRVQISDDAINLLQRLLHREEKKRPTLRQITKSAWMRKMTPISAAISQPTNPRVVHAGSSHTAATVQSSSVTKHYHTSHLKHASKPVYQNSSVPNSQSSSSSSTPASSPTTAFKAKT